MRTIGKKHKKSNPLLQTRFEYFKAANIWLLSLFPLHFHHTWQPLQEDIILAKIPRLPHCPSQHQSIPNALNKQTRNPSLN